MLFLRIPDKSEKRRPSDGGLNSSSASHSHHKPRRKSATVPDQPTYILNGQEVTLEQPGRTRGHSPAIYIADDSGLKIRVRIRGKEINVRHRRAISPPAISSSKFNQNGISRSASYASLTDAVDNIQIKPTKLRPIPSKRPSTGNDAKTEDDKQRIPSDDHATKEATKEATKGRRKSIKEIAKEECGTSRDETDPKGSEEKPRKSNLWQRARRAVLKNESNVAPAPLASQE